jgi:hypothetical protein
MVNNVMKIKQLLLLQQWPHPAGDVGKSVFLAAYTVQNSLNGRRTTFDLWFEPMSPNSGAAVLATKDGREFHVVLLSQMSKANVFNEENYGCDFVEALTKAKDLAIGLGFAS